MVFMTWKDKAEDGGLGGGCQIYLPLSVYMRINVSEKIITPGKTGIMDCLVYPDKTILRRLVMRENRRMS